MSRARGLHAGTLIPHGRGNPQARLDLQQRCILRHRLHRRSPYCAYCGRRVSRKRSTLDHIRPIIRGGRDSGANLVLSCRDCNQSKGDRTPVEWCLAILRAALALQLRALAWALLGIRP